MSMTLDSFSWERKALAFLVEMTTILTILLDIGKCMRYNDY